MCLCAFAREIFSVERYFSCKEGWTIRAEYPSRSHSMDALSQRLTTLSPKERTLFQLLLEERREQRARQLIPRAPQAEWYPLSFAQERLWFLHQLEPNSSFYNIPLAVQLHGALRSDALEQSLREVVRRHSVMRATLALRNGVAVQTIRPIDEFVVKKTSLEHLPESTHAQATRELVHDEAQEPFALSSEIPIRARLFKLNAEEQVLSLNMHHIACDGWSIGILMKEVATLYDAFCGGTQSPLEELPLQYTDFAVWQKTPEQTAMLERQLLYWKQQLREWKPADAPSENAVKTFSAGRAYSEWPPWILQKLKDLSREQGVTLFMTLLAAFQTLLHWRSKRGQVLVGTPSAGRSRTEVEPLIGCFINTLVMQTDLSGNPSFRELLARVKQTVLGAFVNQDVPFDKVVAALQPERRFQHTQIFNVWFVLQNAPLPALELHNLTLRPVWTSSETSKFDLMLSMQEETGELLTGIWRYNRDLFAPKTIAGMLKQFQVLVERVATDPDIHVDDINVENLDDLNQLSVTQFDDEIASDAAQQFNF